MATIDKAEAVFSSVDPFTHRPGAGLSALILDPSNYSMAYDYSLCSALSEQGCGITLVRSEDLYGVDRPDHNFLVNKHFYSRTHAYAREHTRGRAWKAAKAAEHLLNMRSLAAAVERIRPGVVHFQWLPIPLVDSILLKRIHRAAPLVLTLHNTSAYHGESAYRLQGLGTRAALNRFDAIIVHTDYSRQNLLQRRWVHADRIHVIPHGVLNHGTAAITRTAKPEHEVLCFGTIKHYKGIDLLIRALPLLPPELRGRVRLHIAGYPTMDVSPLKALAAQLGVSNRIAWRLGFIPDDEVPALFAAATLIALPYRDIDQSGVLLTAIGSARPVIATRIGGITETIQDGVHGRLVPPESPEALAQALAEILDDEHKRSSMEAAMRKLQRELSWDSIAQKTIQLYRALQQNR